MDFLVSYQIDLVMEMYKIMFLLVFVEYYFKNVRGGVKKTQIYGLGRVSSWKKNQARLQVAVNPTQSWPKWLLNILFKKLHFIFLNYTSFYTLLLNYVNANLHP